MEDRLVLEVRIQPMVWAWMEAARRLLASHALIRQSVESLKMAKMCVVEVTLAWEEASMLMVVPQLRFLAEAEAGMAVQPLTPFPTEAEVGRATRLALSSP